MVVRSILLFVLAAVAEIGGAWLIWQGVREHRGWAWIGGGVIALGLYGFVATAARRTLRTNPRRLRRHLRRRIAPVGHGARRLPTGPLGCVGRACLPRRRRFDHVRPSGRLSATAPTPNGKEYVTIRIEFLAAPGCPNAAAARTTLASSLAELNRDVPIVDRIGRYPSPTILIDGVDVMRRGSEVPTGDACRLDLPTPQDIREALLRAQTS